MTFTRYSFFILHNKPARVNTCFHKRSFSVFLLPFCVQNVQEPSVTAATESRSRLIKSAFKQKDFTLTATLVAPSPSVQPRGHRILQRFCLFVCFCYYRHVFDPPFWSEILNLETKQRSLVYSRAGISCEG